MAPPSSQRGEEGARDRDRDGPAHARGRLGARGRRAGGAGPASAPRGTRGRHDDRANNARLLDELKAVPPAERTARFRAPSRSPTPPTRPAGTLVVREGTCEGDSRRPARAQRFGYDPLFLYPPLAVFAELASRRRTA